MFVGVVSLQAAVSVQDECHAHRVAVGENGVHNLQRRLVNQVRVLIVVNPNGGLVANHGIGEWKTECVESEPLDFPMAQK